MASDEEGYLYDPKYDPGYEPPKRVMLGEPYYKKVYYDPTHDYENGDEQLAGAGYYRPRIERVSPDHDPNIPTVTEIGANLKEKSLEAHEEGRHVEGLLYSSGYMGVSIVEGGARTAISTTRIVTDPIGVLSDIGYVATHIRPTIRAAGMALADDPIRVVGNVAGGVAVGYAAGKVVSKLRGPKTVKTVETKTIRKPRLSRGISRTSYEAKKVVIHDNDFLLRWSAPKSVRDAVSKQQHYVQTGAGLMETYPYSGGVESTVYQITNRVTRAPTRLRGAITISRTVTTQIPRTTSIAAPIAGGALGTFSHVKPGPPITRPDEIQRNRNIQGLGQRTKQLRDIRQIEKTQQKTKQKPEQALEIGPATRIAQVPEVTYPQHTPEPQIIRPIARTVVVQTPIPPMHTPKTVPVMTPRYKPLTIQKTVVTPRERQRTPTLFIPQAQRLTLTAPTPKRRRRKQKKMGYDPLKLQIWGEFRVNPVKTPEAVLRSMMI